MKHDTIPGIILNEKNIRIHGTATNKTKIQDDTVSLSSLLPYNFSHYLHYQGIL